MGIILFWLNIVVSSLPSLGEIYILLAKSWKFWNNELIQQSWAEKEELDKLITTITLSYSQNVNHQPFTCQPHKMVKHTQAIRRLLPINWVSILWGSRLCQFGYIKYLSMELPSFVQENLQMSMCNLTINETSQLANELRKNMNWTLLREMVSMVSFWN